LLESPLLTKNLKGYPTFIKPHLSLVPLFLDSDAKTTLNPIPKVITELPAN
jgi:hypothetical protein